MSATMRKATFAAIVLALTLAGAAPAVAEMPGNFYMLTGKIGKIACWEEPSFDGTSNLRCEAELLPAPDWEPRISIHCLDQTVARACSKLQDGDLVLVVGEEKTGNKYVEHVGFWLDGAF